MKTVTIYTDGACSGNPGPGGWGAILMYNGHRKELSGGEAQTTNNRMELTGVIAALEALKEACVVELYSDSKYIIDGLGKGWAKGWRARGWVKSDKKPALNPDLWGKLLDLCEQHTLHLHWVKGHAENEFNNRCDQLAVAESQKFKYGGAEMKTLPPRQRWGGSVFLWEASRFSPWAEDFFCGGGTGSGWWRRPEYPQWAPQCRCPSRFP